MTDEDIEKERLHIIEMADAYNEFGALEDGYIYYWPAPNRGGMGASILRLIADELDRRNKKWDDQINNDPIFGTTNET